jgi:hypothetical protein
VKQWEKVKKENNKKRKVTRRIYDNVKREGDQVEGKKDKKKVKVEKNSGRRFKRRNYI